MSTETPASGASWGPTVSESGVAWETLLGLVEGPVSRSQLASELVERDHAEVQPEAVDMIDGAIRREELVVSEAGAVAVPSRQTNLNKSVNSATPENPPSESAGETGSPSIEEKTAEFAAEYPIRATVPLAERDGSTIRRDYAEIDEEPWVEEQPDAPEFEAKNPVEGADEIVSAPEWGAAVRTLLEKYERTQNTTINLEKGDWRNPDEHAEFSVSAENRWFASYQEKYYAQLNGWLRELCGKGRPSGGYTEASFDDPHIVLLTRSASSVPDGDRVGPVDHAETLVDSWEPVYHTLRNTLRSQGYELGESWQYDRRLEPHTGKRGEYGINECYPHEHIILVVDGEVSADELRPVMDKHVSACEWAGADAHGEEAIEVKRPDELNDVAAYVADYCSIDPVSLWERSPAYVGFAAAMDAGNVRTVSRSEAAREAAQADKCRQRFESEEAEQSHDHGEEVRREMGSGRIVCSECGTAHDIDQSQTLVEARSPESPEPLVAPDGGAEVPDREGELRDAWPSADAAAAVGESPARTKQREAVRRWLETDMSIGEFWAREAVGVRPPECPGELVAEVKHPEFDPSVVVGFEGGVPVWRVESVTVDGEKHGASAGNGIEMVEIENVRGRLSDGLSLDGGKYRCRCGVCAYGATMASHLMSHGIEEPGIARELVTLLH